MSDEIELDDSFESEEFLAEHADRTGNGCDEDADD